MRTLIQRKNGEYWAGQNTWTQIAEAAYRFSSSVAALNFIAMNKLSAVSLVFKFDNPSYDIHIPLAGMGGNFSASGSSRSSHY